MADINTMFPSNWIKAPDLGGRRVTVRMSHVKIEEVGDDKKPVLYFQGTNKGLVLNVTNANMIKEITGTGETNDWHGRMITLFVTKVEYGGKRVDGIRVDHPDNQARQAPPTQPRPAPPVVAAPMTALGSIAEASPFRPVEETFATGPELSDDDIPF